MIFFPSVEALSQLDSVDVTFRYKGPSFPQVYLVGEFNNWLSADPKLAMAYQAPFWVITKRLNVGGNPAAAIPGSWQYKFYYNGASPWPDDSLDHHLVPNNPDGNSFIYSKDPTIYQLLPNQRQARLRTDRPTFSAYIFPKVSTIVDTSTISLRIDGTTYSVLGKYYDTGSKLFQFQVPSPLSSGSHTAILTAGSTAVGGAINSDTVTFTVPGFVQITNLGNFATRNPMRKLYGTVIDTSIHLVRILRNNSTLDSASFANGQYNITASLVEGLNVFRASVRDSQGITHVSDSVNITYAVNHAPNADIRITTTDSTITLDASNSTDPDAGQTALLKFVWSSEPGNPALLPQLDSTKIVNVTIAKPSAIGEYYVRLVASDTSGNRDTTRSFFTVYKDSVRGATLATVPQWVKNGRIYSFFFKGLTPEGTINAALPYLPYIKKMGFNILWILPVMKNHYPIDNGPGPGYDITDFYNVAPEYGTNDDFKNFVYQAHQQGLKVVLDVTPNHTSAGHPFALNARQYGVNSPYWTFYQHQLLMDVINYHPNLSEAITSDGFVYYGGFSSELLNWNWSDVDARQYMIDMFASWVKNFDIDGYRLDVYWGPHDRANGGNGGENEMGIPLRKALKKAKPGLYLLGETSGTGGGTQVNYADQGGGVDGAYDWNLKDAVHGLYPNGTLTGYQSFVNGLGNGGFYPGGNSSYLRFLENQDEDRIVTLYKTYETTKPPSVAIFTAPGMPMIWEGQELGIGLLVSAGDPRRAVVNWNQTDFHNLLPHYQRLAQIRGQFPGFSTQNMKLLSSPTPVLAYLRPYPGEDGIVAINFADTSARISLQIQSSDLATTIQNNKQYKLNDLYSDTTATATFTSGLYTLNLSLPPFSSGVFVLSDSVRRVTLPPLTSVDEKRQSSLPESYRVYQNYPNPFNPSTTLRYDLPRQSEVSLKVYNLLGEEIATLVETSIQSAGTHSVVWNAAGRNGAVASSGVYFARLQASAVGGGGSFVSVTKLVLIK